METKAQIQLWFHLICCLSSDSMWSHPEIPHKTTSVKHMTLQPCNSHATARSAQRQQGSPKRSAKANKSRCRRNRRHGRRAWCNAVHTECRRRLGNESSEAVITLWFGMALSRMCIASAWMCAAMISSRWWLTWWYLIACHHLTCRTNCAVLIRTEYQRCILHVIVLMFSFFLIIYPVASTLRFFRPGASFQEDKLVYGTQVRTCKRMCMNSGMNWSCACAIIRYDSISVSDQNPVHVAASKFPLITLVARRHGGPMDGAVCL